MAINSFEEAKEFFVSARNILQEAGMNLRKWGTNNIEMRKICKDSGIISKVLGIIWNKQTDELSIQIPQNKETVHATKRNILQLTASVFDPMGFLSPFTIIPRIILQDIWKLKLGWDQNVPDELEQKWRKWKMDLNDIKEFYLPRNIYEAKDENPNLHIFCDARPKAYGMVAYLVQSNKSYLIGSKNRIAPIKASNEATLTIPKLELTAALIGVRFATFLCNNLNIRFSNVVFWTDSKITLYWIRGNINDWKPYVANRVSEINELSVTEQWKFCPGEENPADLLTRGLSIKSFIGRKFWHNGPDWLVNDIVPNFEEDDIDIARVSSLLCIETKFNKFDAIFDIENYSSFTKVIRVTAYVIRFVKIIMRKVITEHKLQLEELQEAENYWIRWSQRQYFPEEVSDLTKNKSVRKSSTILTLNPWKSEDGLMRLTGRLQQAKLDFETKHPVILSNKSYLAKLLVNHYHINLHHAGVESVIVKVREKFWVLQIRPLVKRILHSCIVCRKLKGKAASEPFAQLPKDRLIGKRPFKMTGVDFAGPLYVVNESKEKSKVYILLLTCALTRAIHLELVTDLTTHSCLRALRRFFARRAVPEIIYSDNAKTFKACSDELKKLNFSLLNPELHELALKFNIKWKFIIERASWWGGWWERMIRTVKMSLKATIGKANINYDELHTILTEVEATVNSRPLTYIGNDINDFIPLTPQNFLIVKCFEEELKPDVEKDLIRKIWSERQRILQSFWKRWQTEYLQQLRSAHHNYPTKSSEVHE